MELSDRWLGVMSLAAGNVFLAAWLLDPSARCHFCGELVADPLVSVGLALVVVGFVLASGKEKEV